MNANDPNDLYAKMQAMQAAPDPYRERLADKERALLKQIKINNALMQAIKADLKAIRGLCSQEREGCDTEVPCNDCPHNFMGRSMRAVLKIALDGAS